MSETGAEALVGRVFGGRYQVLRLIGRGAMGAVFEGVQLDLGRRVALKVLFDDGESAVARFRQEALLLGSLNHPNVVQVTDLVTDEELGAGIVMELLEGRSLANVIAAGAPFPPTRAAAIAIQMLAGLAAAHARGIIHRDVKPSNVQLVRSGNGPELVKVLDFGIAKSLDAGAYRTTTGVVLGTPAYMAPEQIRGEPADARTDLHAVAACLYEMLTGSKITAPATGPEVARAVLGLDPTRAIAGKEPRALFTVVARALAGRPEDRFPSATAMASALEEAMGRREPQSANDMSDASQASHPGQANQANQANRAANPPSPDRRPHVFGIALVVTAILGGIGLVLLLFALAPRRSTPGPGPGPGPSAPVAIPPTRSSAAIPVVGDAGAGADAAAPLPSASTLGARPTSRARAPSSRACFCRADVNGRSTILSPNQRSCTCNPAKGGGGLANRPPLCLVPNKVDGTFRCERTAMAEPGEFHEALPCKGWTIDAHENTATETAGLVQCYADEIPATLPAGHSCVGWANGKRIFGAVLCDP